jgi:putative hydrolase of the HAD superfamily
MEWCRENELKVGLLSNTEHGNVELTLLEKFGIYHYFDGIVFSSEVGIRKPNRGIFYYITEKLALSPKEMVHIGDWPEIDVVGAKGVGMKAIFFNNEKITYPKGLILPDAEIKEFKEIPKIVERF